MTSQKSKKSSCDSTNVGRHFISKQTHVGHHFCPDFQLFSKRFHKFCPDLHVFCPDFYQIKTFGVALALPAPLPPTPLTNHLWCWESRIVGRWVFNPHLLTCDHWFLFFHNTVPAPLPQSEIFRAHTSKPLSRAVSHNGCLEKFILWHTWTSISRPVTRLRHQGCEEFSERVPNFLNYVQ